MAARMLIVLLVGLVAVHAEVFDFYRHNEKVESRSISEEKEDEEETEIIYPKASGTLPKELLTVEDFNENANRVLDKTTRDYLQDGSDLMVTLRENMQAFSRYRIRPRALRNVSDVDTAVEVLGNRIAFPVGVCPMAFQMLFHPEGEMATARGAASAGALMGLSTYTNTAMEDIMQKAGEGLRWKQVYVYRNRSETERIVKNAEKSGYKALMVTVDSPTLGRKLNDNKNGFKLPTRLRLPNFVRYDQNQTGNIKDTAKAAIDDAITWKDLAWIKSITTLPVVVKGIMRGDDALQAVQFGANGILVSNHGGRQLDDAPATIEVLPEVVKAVNGQAEVYLDGGVRTGMDIFKALAMGARAAFVGRPIIYGLVHSGQDGVSRVLEILKDELQRTMALSGVRRIKDIRPSDMVRNTYYARLWQPDIKSQP